MPLIITALIVIGYNTIAVVRLHYINNWFKTTILTPWRQAIEDSRFNDALVYQAKAYAFLNDFFKLVFMPWRKLPKGPQP